VAQIIATKSKIVYTSVDRFRGLFKALSKPPFFDPHSRQASTPWD
jgi:hypothetical protein